MEEESAQCNTPEADAADFLAGEGSEFSDGNSMRDCELTCHTATMATYSPSPSTVDVEEDSSSAQEKRARIRIHEPEHTRNHGIIREL